MVDSSQVLRMKNQNGAKNNNEILAELQCDGVPIYYVRQQRCIVGRDQQANHMAISSSNLVSRQHIEVWKTITLNANNRIGMINLFSSLCKM